MCLGQFRIQSNGFAGCPFGFAGFQQISPLYPTTLAISAANRLIETSAPLPTLTRRLGCADSAASTIASLNVPSSTV